ncbi:restriction endonuclease [Streptomyces sp. NPDC059072]|uniref:restriction endonuclease n=1 Tax=Streptomyces sp. NPDC059072 TaxID=3346715 RepID=UPI0036B068F0
MIQCKHFQGENASVGQPVVQHVYGGAMSVHLSTLAIVVTNSRITGGARVWAKENGKVRLVPRDALKSSAEDGETLTDVVAPKASAQPAA